MIQHVSSPTLILPRASRTCSPTFAGDWLAWAGNLRRFFGSTLLTVVAEGIEAMTGEAAYWLGMAMHRKHLRRVLTALWFLLTEPKRRADKLVTYDTE